MSELILPKVTVILRGYDTKQVLSVVEQLVGTKVNSIEVASNSPHVAESIAQAKKEFGTEVHVGAGTVTTMERAKAAIDAGAEFVLSPIMFSEEIMAEAKAAGVITVPSAFSPSEIYRMFEMGADIVKVFPAGQLGPDYIKAVQALWASFPLWSSAASTPTMSSPTLTRARLTPALAPASLTPKTLRSAILQISRLLSRSSKRRSFGRQRETRRTSRLIVRRETWQTSLLIALWLPLWTRKALLARTWSVALPAS